MAGMETENVSTLAYKAQPLDGTGMSAMAPNVVPSAVSRNPLQDIALFKGRGENPSLIMQGGTPHKNRPPTHGAGTKTVAAAAGPAA